MERSTIKLEVNLINKIKEIQSLQGYKSVNETVKHLLPSGVGMKEEFIKEQPAFTIDTVSVSWNELREAENGAKWGDKETATIIYSDEYGSLVRFIDEYDDVYVNYFHYL